MTEALFLAIFVFSMLGALLLAGLEAATLAVNRQTLMEKLREAGEYTDDAFALVSDTQRALDVALVGVNTCAVVGAVALHAALRRLIPEPPFPGAGFVLTVAVAAPACLVMADVLARPLARRRSETFLMSLRAPLRLCAAFMPHLLRGCAWLAQWVLRPFGVERPSAKRRMTLGEIMAMVGESERSGSIEESEREMIHGAIDLQKSSVREVMRPLVDVVALKYPEANVATALELARSTGYSRFPVFRRRIIEIREYVDIASILQAGAEDGPLGPHLRKSFIVPETMRIDVLLRAFTEEREHCATVVDEFGGVVGWVTREDVLEEIVGDIADKDADEEPGWTRDEEGAYHVDARIDLDDLNEAIDADFQKGDDFDTLGGWLYQHIGRVPDVGDSVEEDEAFVTVEEMDAHRILRAVVRIVEEEEDKENNGH